MSFTFFQAKQLNLIEMKRLVKKLQKPFIKKGNRFLVLKLGILGFSTCANFSCSEYASPYADFIVNGKVKSAKTEQPIKNIQVTMYGDTAYTNESGDFVVKLLGGEQSPATFAISFNDIDGENNGSFYYKDTTVAFSGENFSGGDGWYAGQTETDIEVVLDDKTDE